MAQTNPACLVGSHSVLYQTRSSISCLQQHENPSSSRPQAKPLDIHQAGNDYEVIETGIYRDFAGELRFHHASGRVRVSYDFIYTGADLRARVGFQFGVPLWCDKFNNGGVANGLSIPTITLVATTRSR
jgi:hypothetical protein